MTAEEKAFFNEVAQGWDAAREADPAKLGRLIGLSGVAAGDAVLDVGCGTGVLTPLLAAAVGDDGHVAAVDFAEEMVRRARAKHARLANVSFFAGDILDYKADRAFDAVVCLNVFPHLPEKRAFLRHMHACLRPGGTLAIMHDRSRTEVNAIHGGAAPVRKHRLPAAAEVAELLTAAGFEVRADIDDSDLYFVKGIK